MPPVKNQITLDKIPLQNLLGFSVAKHIITNEEGVKFIGHDIILNIKDKNPVKGWISEADLLQLRQLTGRVLR